MIRGRPWRPFGKCISRTDAALAPFEWLQAQVELLKRGIPRQRNTATGHRLRWIALHYCHGRNRMANHTSGGHYRNSANANVWQNNRTRPDVEIILNLLAGSQPGSTVLLFARRSQSMFTVIPKGAASGSARAPSDRTGILWLSAKFTAA